MSKYKQTRRSVSISGELHAALKTYCEENELSNSALVEELARRIVGMPPRDAALSETVWASCGVSSRPAMRPAPKLEPDDKEVVTPPEVLPAEDPKVPACAEDSEDLSRLLNKPVRFVEKPIETVRPRDPSAAKPEVDKPATPDAPDLATEDVLATREADRVAAVTRESLAAERKKKFDDWARQHSTSADQLKPNGKRRGGNVHLF